MNKLHVYCIVIVVLLISTMIANHQANTFEMKAMQLSIQDRSLENVSLVDQYPILPQNPKNLAAMTANGTPPAIATVHHTIMSHLAHNEM